MDARLRYLLVQSGGERILRLRGRCLNKDKYERSELEIIRFQTDDVIMTSGWDDDVYEGWNPNNPGSGGDGYEGWMPQ